MTRILNSLIFSLVLSLFATATAIGQDLTAFMTPPFLPGKRMPAPRLFIGTPTAQLLSDAFTGGRGDGPALRFAASMGSQVAREAVMDRAERPRRSEDRTPTLERAGSNGGYGETSQYLRGAVVGIRGVQWDETMKSLIGDQLDKLGATLNGSTSSDPCVIPGTRVLCLVVGQFQPVDDDQRYGSFSSGIWGAAASQSDSQWRQRYAVAFTVKVFDTPEPTQANPNPREPAFQPEIASARGIGSAQGGQRYWTINANGTSVSNGQSHQDYHTLAMVDAIVDALGKINWRRSALQFLAGK